MRWLNSVGFPVSSLQEERRDPISSYSFGMESDAVANNLNLPIYVSMVEWARLCVLNLCQATGCGDVLLSRTCACIPVNVTEMDIFICNVKIKQESFKRAYEKLLPSVFSFGSDDIIPIG